MGITVPTLNEPGADPPQVNSDDGVTGCLFAVVEESAGHFEPLLVIVVQSVTMARLQA